MLPLTKGHLSHKERIVWQKGYLCDVDLSRPVLGEVQFVVDDKSSALSNSDMKVTIIQRSRIRRI